MTPGPGGRAQACVAGAGAALGPSLHPLFMERSRQPGLSLRPDSHLEADRGWVWVCPPGCVVGGQVFERQLPLLDTPAHKTFLAVLPLARLWRQTVERRRLAFLAGYWRMLKNSTVQAFAHSSFIQECSSGNTHRVRPRARLREWGGGGGRKACDRTEEGDPSATCYAWKGRRQTHGPSVQGPVQGKRAPGPPG